MNYSKTRKNTQKTQHRKLKRRATRILPNPDIYEGYLVLVYYRTLDELLVVKPGKNLIFGIRGGNNLRKRRKIHCQMMNIIEWFVYIMPYQIFSLLNLDASVVGNKTFIVMKQYTQHII